MAEALAMSQKTVIQGRRELEGKSPGKPGEGVLTGGRQRRAGGGRKPAVKRQPWGWWKRSRRSSIRRRGAIR